MTVTYDGIRATDPAPAGAKFRATWKRNFYVGSLLYYSGSARAAEQAVQETGPTKGFYVVSPLAAAPDDDAFVLDVRTQQTWKGSAAQLASLLNDSSGFDLTQLTAVDRPLPAGQTSPAGKPYVAAKETAAAAASARADAQAQAAKAAAAEAATTSPAAAAAAVTSGVKHLVMWVAIGAGAFLVLTNLGTIKAVGRAVKRGVK